MRNKKVLFSILLLICISKIEAQQWALKGGGDGPDGGESIIADKFGNIYSTGYFSSNATFGTTVLHSIAFNDGYISKYDTAGNFIWAKGFGGTGHDYPKVLAVDTDNNIIVAGTFSNSNRIQIGNIILNTNNNHDNYFIAKFDSNGNVIWAEANEGFLTFNDIAIDSQKNINLIGILKSKCIFGTDTIIPYYESPGYYSWDIILAQFNTSGSLNWAKKAGGNGTDIGESISTDTFDNILITGSIEKVAYFDTIVQNTYNNNTNRDAYIAKLGVSGKVLFVKNYGNINSSCWGYEIKYFNNKVYLSGHYIYSIILGNDTLTGTSGVFISKLDTFYNFLWSTKATGVIEVKGMDVDQNENIYITGNFHYTAIFGSDTLSNNLHPDIFTSIISSNGSFVSTKRAGGKNSDYSSSLSLDQDGNAYVTGNFLDTAKFGEFTLIAYPLSPADIFITKYNSINPHISISELNKKTFKIIIYPNPANQFITIESSEAISEIELINLYGEKIYCLELNSNRAILNLSNQTKGVYFIRLTDANKSVTTKKLVIVD